MITTASFEKLNNEPAAAYAKFVIYRDLGEWRSLIKAYQVYVDRRAEEATKLGQELGLNQVKIKKEVKHLPGQWVRLSRLYRWHKRADDFDWDLIEKREKERDLQRKKAMKERVAQEVAAQFEGYSFRFSAT